MKKIPLIIDCDPGHDDAIALMLAASSDKFDIKAVTCVGGAQSVDKTFYNARRVLAAIGLEVPCARGAQQPMIRKALGGTEIVHGESGLDGPILPEPLNEGCGMTAFELLCKVLQESDEPVTICPTGPLTNIGILLAVRPDLKSKIKEFSIMGGGFYMGNWTAAAEFNILADPEAAKVVFDSGIPIIMSGLDVTHKAYVTREENEVLRQNGNRCSVLAAELIDYFSRYHYEVEKLPGCTLHDPCAIAYLMVPEIFSGKMCNVQIDVDGVYTLGKTVVDWFDHLKAPKNVNVLYDVDREAFVKLLVEQLAKLR